MTFVERKQSRSCFITRFVIYYPEQVTASNNEVTTKIILKTSINYYLGAFDKGGPGP